jgi:hypothetical protein
MTPERFREKTRQVDAVQLAAENAYDVNWWISLNGGQASEGNHRYPLIVATPDGQMCAGLGDWIVRDQDGYFWVLSTQVFTLLYEPV